MTVPGSAYINDWFTVNVSGAACPAGLRTDYDTWTSGSGTHWYNDTSFSDYWSSEGYRTYYSEAQCVNPTTGRASVPGGTGSDGINIVPPPPQPGYPGGPDIVDVNMSYCDVSPYFNPSVPPDKTARMNASSGNCYWQQAQARDTYGNPIPQSELAWGPAYPGDKVGTYVG